MKRIVKIGLSILLLLVVILLLALGIFLYFLDVNKLKPVLIQEVAKRTGYTLAIDGPLSLSFYPRLGVKIEHLTLASPSQSRPFLEIKGMRLATTNLTLFSVRNQSVEANLRLDDVKLMHVHADHASVKLHWKNNILTLSSLHASLYQGNLTGTIKGKNLKQQPSWTWNVLLNNVQVKPLLADMNPRHTVLTVSGLGTVNFTGVAYGKNKDQLLKSLNGTVAFGLAQGKLEGIDLNYFLESADALLNKQSIASIQSTGETVFEHFSGSAIIQNGVAQTNNTSLVSTAFTANAKGTVNLADAYLYLQLALKSQDKLKTKWQIPVLIKGPLADPDIRLDINEIQKLIAKDELEKLKNKVQEKVNEHFGAPAGDFIKNIFGG